MNNQNNMMDLIWLLNSADTIGQELLSLCDELLAKQGQFLDMEKSIDKNTSRRLYFESEMARSKENLTNLSEKISAAISLLETVKKGDTNCER